MEQTVEGRATGRVDSDHGLDERLPLLLAWTYLPESWSTHPHAIILNCGQLGLNVQLARPVLEQLAQGEQGRAFQEEFCQDAARAEAVHRLRHLALSLPFAFPFTFPLSPPASFGIVFGSKETLRRDVTCSPATGVKEEREVCRVVQRE